MNAHKNEGFTLIELMYVLVILAILASIAIPRVVNITAKTHDTKIAVIAGSIKYAMELYHQENGGYPFDGEDGQAGPANITVNSWSSLNSVLDTLELEDMSKHNIGSEHEDIEDDEVFSYDVKDDGTYELKLGSNTTGIIHVLTPDDYQ